MTIKAGLGSNAAAATRKTVVAFIFHSPPLGRAYLEADQ
jgi:hypothetical protein